MEEGTCFAENPRVLPPPNQGTLAVPRVGERELAAMRSANAGFEPEFVDNVGGEQGLRDRDTCVDADIASPLLLEIPNEFDQPGVAITVVFGKRGSGLALPHCSTVSRRLRREESSVLQ